MKERRLKQLPVRNERRNSQIVMMVERRRVPRKEIAFDLGLTYACVQKIVWRAHHAGSLS